VIRRIPDGAPILTADEMRAAEAAAFASGVSQDTLMERAAAAVAVQVIRLAAGRTILVFAGPGNNGGDAYGVARHLREGGCDAVVAHLGEPKAGAAARMAALWDGPTSSLADAQARPVIVDGLFGIGTVRPFAPDVAATLATLFAQASLSIAIDLPSGRNADTGAGCGRADVTVALGALKPAHVLGPGGAACGHVLLADIGLAVRGTATTIARPDLPRWSHDVNKYSRGTVLVVAGEMPGAAWLAGSAALAAGAGYVTIAGLDPPGGAPHALVRRRLGGIDELAQVLDDPRIGAVVIGPGLGRGDDARELLATALSSSRDLVIDGDALSLLGRDVADRLPRGRRLCLTPHGGEFARMFDGEGTKIDATVAAARRTGAAVVHKGATTVIGLPGGRATVSASASAALSTAGSGDVLAGTIAARMAADGELESAVCAGVWLHTHAADDLDGIFAADRLIDALPAAVARCRTI